MEAAAGQAALANSRVAAAGTSHRLHRPSRWRRVRPTSTPAHWSGDSSTVEPERDGRVALPALECGLTPRHTTPCAGEGACLYKGLGPCAESIFGGSARWDPPGDQRPGAWMPPVARLCPGLEGYHLAPVGDLLGHWLAPRLFVAEGRGAAVPDGTVLVCGEARLVRELRWDAAVALGLYRNCLALAVEEARRHDDFVDEARHRRILADARSWQSKPRWPEVVRLGLADLAAATGGVWHRAERRRDQECHPLRLYIALARDRQAQRFLEQLDDRRPNAPARRHS